MKPTDRFHDIEQNLLLDNGTRMLLGEGVY
jgi:hypothetical protein